MHIYKAVNRDKFITVHCLTTGSSLSEKSEIPVEVKIFWTIWINSTEACKVSKCFLSHYWIEIGREIIELKWESFSLVSAVLETVPVWLMLCAYIWKSVWSGPPTCRTPWVEEWHHRAKQRGIVRLGCSQPPGKVTWVSFSLITLPLFWNDVGFLHNRRNFRNPLNTSQ